MAVTGTPLWVTGKLSRSMPTHSDPTPPPHPQPHKQVLTGDWRNVLSDLQRIEGLQAGEVRDAAARWLAPGNCFKGFVLK